MGPHQRRVERLQDFYSRRTVTWEQAQLFIDALLCACRLHCSPETMIVLEQEFARIIAEASTHHTEMKNGK